MWVADMTVYKNWHSELKSILGGWMEPDYKSHDLLKIQELSLVENLLKKNPLQDFLSSLNAVISTNERTLIYKGSCDF